MPLAISTKRSILTVITSLGLACFGALGEPPTDAQIQQAMDAFDEIRATATSFGDYEQRLGAFEATHPEILDLSGLDAAAIERLTPVMFSTPERAALAITRLTELEHPQTVDGSIALVNGAFFTMMTNRKLPELDRLKIILAHPGLEEAVASGHAEVFFTMLGYIGQYRAEQLREIRDRVITLDRLVSDEMDSENALASTGLFDAVNAIMEDNDEDRAILERFRAKIASALRSARSRTEDGEEISAALDDAIIRTDGAYARGELVGYDAPDIGFLWSSDQDLQAERLSDLRGKVVVLDFWATWCGPCLASIPNIRSLVSYYKDSDVVVLGVTSLQGFHSDQAKGRIDTAGNPDQEYGLMTGFITERNITWPVVFSTQDVFNPEYGIDGIPHMVIIDAPGKVRYRALHPSSDLNEKIAKIDALLVEAGLELPPMSRSAMSGDTPSMVSDDDASPDDAEDTEPDSDD